MLESNQVRKLRKEFRESKQHKQANNESLIPAAEDKTVIFNTAGVQPLVPYLNGKPHKDGNRLFNIQRCIRTGDIDEVGDERHCTWFEMMGNWSLGDYFKKESMNRSIEFLTKVIGLDKEKLGCSIFGGMKDENGNEILPYDTEAEEILLANGIPKERIKSISKKPGEKCDNWWIGGDSGPCGPSAEFHYDRGDDRGPNDWDIGENDRFIEVWNNVFMTFYQDIDGNIKPLKNKNIDTGMGFERLIMVIKDAETLFETDLFIPILEYVQSISNTKYPPLSKKNKDFSDEEILTTKSFRIVADHIRAVSFLIMDGVIPSNESRGYVCRRLIRRLYYHINKLYHNKQDINSLEVLQKIITDIVDVIIVKYGEAYPGLSRERTHIINTLTKETSHFQKTIKKGRKLLDEYISKSSDKVLDGKFAFNLYDTFGFPKELTKEICEELGFKIDEKGFEENMKKAREMAKKASKQKFTKDIDRASHLDGVQVTEFIGWDQVKSSNMQVIKDFVVGDTQRVIIFDKTPFYGEGGGQTGDTGILIDDKGNELIVTNVKKYNGVHLHFIN